MPLYDMQCVNEECNYEFEMHYKLDEVEQATCPKCGSTARCIISNPGHYRHVSWSQWKVGIGS